MSTNGSSSSQSHRRSWSRPQLRSATFILPNGRRVKTDVSFGPNGNLDGQDEGVDERTRLLGDDENDSAQLSYTIKAWIGRQVSRAWTSAKSETGKGVFKCSIAYLLASMATFIPSISALLGKQDGKHIVATVSVYYHPARSIGSMFEATLCATVAFLYAAFLSFSSMGVSIFFGRTLDRIVLGHVIVLVVFCGAGMGFIGWTKQRMSHPLINISCSLTSLATITVLTKEGAVQAAEFSDDKVVQVMVMILMGIAATTATSFLIWPASARRGLKRDLVQATESFGHVLAMVTQGFLSGKEDFVHNAAFEEHAAKNQNIFKSITKRLGEAKYEHLLFGTEAEYHIEQQLVECVQKLAHDLGGLRAAVSTQFVLLSECGPGPSPTFYSKDSLLLRRTTSMRREQWRSPTRTKMEPIEETVEEGTTDGARSPPALEEALTVQSPGDIFTCFIISLGPSMKSLAVTMSRILKELSYDSGGSIGIDPHFAHSLSDAVELYTKSRSEALQLLYKKKEITTESPMEKEADFEEVAASCGRFSFSLLDFAYQMKRFLEVLDELKLEAEERPDGRSWNWLKFWRKHHSIDAEVNIIDANRDTQIPGDVPKHDTIEANPRRFGKIRRAVLGFLAFFKRDDIKFAIKVGIGAALYALPSFLPSTRPFYSHWRGEWGLLSYMLVCSMTVGASNTTGFARFFGTCIGAVCAIVGWTISQGYAVPLAIFGWFMAYWTAYIIVAQGKAPMGRFIMLTYNLSALYAYSLSVKDAEGDDDEGGANPAIVDIALHRVVAVLTGCLWGLIVTRVIWPISARQKLKDGLSILWLRMGLVWRRDPLNTLVDGAEVGYRLGMPEQFELHRYLNRLEGMRGSASSEWDIRGPFADAAFGRVLQRTAEMLDAFHSMDILIEKKPTISKGERAILKYTAAERASLCARISHLFQVLASSMKLEFPMNSALPGIDHTRDCLLAKLFRFRREEMGGAMATDEDFEIIYAYVLVTGQLSRQIKAMGEDIDQLFGSIDEDSLKLQ